MQGGWVPLAIAAGIFTLMTTWHTGRDIVERLLRKSSLPMNLFLPDLEKKKPVRVPGTAVFMARDPSGAPLVLMHHLKHNKVLHEQVILLSIDVANVPQVSPEERLEIDQLGSGVWRVVARYGFMETPDVPDILDRAKAAGIFTKPLDTTFYLGRESLVVDDESKARLARWRKKLYIFMSKNSRSATAYFGIPSNRVVELGAQIKF